MSVPFGPVRAVVCAAPREIGQAVQLPGRMPARGKCFCPFFQEPECFYVVPRAADQRVIIRRRR